MPYPSLPLSKGKIYLRPRPLRSHRSALSPSPKPCPFSSAAELLALQQNSRDSNNSTPTPDQSSQTRFFPTTPATPHFAPTPPTPTLLPKKPQPKQLTPQPIVGVYLSGSIDTLNASASVTIVDPISSDPPTRHNVHLYSNSFSTITLLSSLSLMPGDVVVFNNVKKEEQKNKKQRRKRKKSLIATNENIEWRYDCWKEGVNAPFVHRVLEGGAICRCCSNDSTEKSESTKNLISSYVKEMCERSGKEGVNVEESVISRLAIWAYKEGVAVEVAEEATRKSYQGGNHQHQQIKNIVQDAYTNVACTSATGFMYTVKGKISSLESDGGICPKAPRSRRLSVSSGKAWCTSGWCILSDGPSLDSTIVLHGIPPRLMPAFKQAVKKDRMVLIKNCMVRTADLKLGDGRRPEVVRDGGVQGDGVFLFTTSETKVILLGNSGEDEEEEEEEKKGGKDGKEPEKEAKKNYAKNKEEGIEEKLNDSCVKTMCLVKNTNNKSNPSKASSVSTSHPVLGVGKGLIAPVRAFFLPEFNLIIDKSNAEAIASSVCISVLETAGLNKWSDVLLKESKPSEYRSFHVTLASTNPPYTDIVAICPPAIVLAFLLSIPSPAVAKDETLAKKTCDLMANAVADKTPFNWILEKGASGWTVIRVTLNKLE